MKIPFLPIAELLAEHSPSLAIEIVEQNVGSLLTLVRSGEEGVQLSGLQLLSSLAYSSPVCAQLSSKEGLRLRDCGLTINYNRRMNPPCRLPVSRS